jgi:CPW-WPC domain-containing protein
MSGGALCMVLLVSDVISHVGGTTSLPNMEMGEAIADLLKNDLTGKSEAFNSAFQDAVASKQQGLVNPEVSKIQQAANKMAGQMEQLTEADSVCTRDYSKTCPEGWADLGGSKCEAPKAYGGACATLESFQGYSPLQKAAYAEACKAPWPCFGECSEGRDYDHLCPAEWTDIGGGICQAPSTYAGSCLKQYKFDTYTLEKKEQVAHACGFQWPCRAPCVREYSSACPAGWTELSFVHRRVSIWCQHDGDNSRSEGGVRVEVFCAVPVQSVYCVIRPSVSVDGPRWEHGLGDHAALEDDG